MARTISTELHGEAPSRRHATRKPPCCRPWKAPASSSTTRSRRGDEGARARTPATRADTIDGLVNQKYIERQQRELVPTAKAESLLQFLAAVKAEGLTKPDMTGEWEYKLRQIEHGKVFREKFMKEIVAETRGIIERVKGFEEDELRSRGSQTFCRRRTVCRCAKPCAATNHRTASSWSTRSSPIGRSRRPKCVNLSPRSRRTARRIRVGQDAQRFAGLAPLVKDEETGKWKGRAGFGDKVDLDTLTPFWTDPRTGAELCEAGNNFVLREHAGDGWKQTFRVWAHHVSKAAGPRAGVQLIEQGKTELIQGFISRKGRPFDAFLKREEGRIAWEFPPRTPKLDKDGNPIARKAKAPPDLSKAVKVGESKLLAGEILQTGDAYYVRKPGDNGGRVVFTIKRHLCRRRFLLRKSASCWTRAEPPHRGLHLQRMTPFKPSWCSRRIRPKAQFEFPPR